MVKLTYWGRDKMATILQKTFRRAFSWMKTFKFEIKYHEMKVPYGLIYNIAVLVQIMAWGQPIFWRKNIGLFYWPLYASYGLNELIPVSKTCPRSYCVTMIHNLFFVECKICPSWCKWLWIHCGIYLFVMRTIFMFNTESRIKHFIVDSLDTTDVGKFLLHSW